jgi:amidophosphoribosyltransferase
MELIMSKLGDFIAFKAADALLKDRNMEYLLTQALDKIKELQRNNQLHTENVVRSIYKPLTGTLEISDKIAELITPAGVEVDVHVIYQTIEDLHDSRPTNNGDWYLHRKLSNSRR